jgi:hypothetical protein
VLSCEQFSGVLQVFLKMVGSIADNASIYKKQPYKYVPPTPPSNLIDSTTFVLDFTDRKFVHIGLDPADEFNVAVHILTSSRHISISPGFLTRIYLLMGNILSIILDSPEKTKENIFLTDETIKLSKMVYRGQNVLVIESLIKDGCRVLLNRQDLIKLQYLEWSIFESVTRKISLVRPKVIKQMDQISSYLKKMYNIQKKTASVEKLVTFIKGITDDKITNHIPKNDHSFISQIKLLATEQLALNWISIMNESFEVNNFIHIKNKHFYLLVLIILG